jgi:hypothetical protein
MRANGALVEFILKHVEAFEKRPVQPRGRGYKTSRWSGKPVRPCTGRRIEHLVQRETSPMARFKSAVRIGKVDWVRTNNAGILV